MDHPRVIPCLLLDRGGLYKTVRFSEPSYVGDPINTVRLFNDKEVDELVVLDIGARRRGESPPYDLLRDLAGECFMPLCYGGGVRTSAEFRRLIHLGIEKVAVNTAAVDTPDLVTESARLFGRQAVVGSIDVRRRADGRPTVHIDAGRTDTGLDAVAHARALEHLGVGEILLTSIDREGTGDGFDLDLVAAVAEAVDVPVVAHGGAGCVEDLHRAVRAGASAVAAGSLFVYYGRHRAVLVNYPDREARAALAV